MAPNRKSDLAALAMRALIAGTLACFMTACVAGKFLTVFITVCFGKVVDKRLLLCLSGILL